MPEGDTIRWHANRLKPVLEGRVPQAIRTHRGFAHDRWAERLSGRSVRSVDARGKHLMLWFEDDLVLHSHLGMVGTWGVYRHGRRWGRSPGRAWLVLVLDGADVVQFDGSTLELMTRGRARFDPRLAALGPDILGEQFAAGEFRRRLRLDDPTRPIGEGLLDQRIVAGIGNMWKAEGCWEAGVDPWRAAGAVSDAETARIIEKLRPRMMESAMNGPRSIEHRVYGRRGQPCPRCATPIRSRGQGEDNRLTFWCPGCQA